MPSNHFGGRALEHWWRTTVPAVRLPSRPQPAGRRDQKPSAIRRPVRPRSDAVPNSASIPTSLIPPLTANWPDRQPERAPGRRLNITTPHSGGRDSRRAREASLLFLECEETKPSKGGGGPIRSWCGVGAAEPRPRGPSAGLPDPIDAKWNVLEPGKDR
jgi:hypothetical protein